MCVCVCETANGSYPLCGRRRGSPLPRRLLRARGGAALSRDGWRRGSPPTYGALVRRSAAWRARRCAPLCERFYACTACLCCCWWWWCCCCWCRCCCWRGAALRLGSTRASRASDAAGGVGQVRFSLGWWWWCCCCCWWCRCCCWCGAALRRDSRRASRLSDAAGGVAGGSDRGSTVEVEAGGCGGL